MRRQTFAQEISAACPATGSLALSKVCSPCVSFNASKTGEMGIMFVESLASVSAHEHLFILGCILDILFCEIKTGFFVSMYVVLLHCSWEDPIAHPPYAINNQGWRGPLGTKTLAVTGKHNNGWLQYNTHNLYGFSEARSSYQAMLETTGQRPFLLSRCVFDKEKQAACYKTSMNARWYLVCTTSCSCHGCKHMAYLQVN